MCVYVLVLCEEREREEREREEREKSFEWIIICEEESLTSKERKSLSDLRECTLVCSLDDTQVCRMFSLHFHSQLAVTVWLVLCDCLKQWDTFSHISSAIDLIIFYSVTVFPPRKSIDERARINCKQEKRKKCKTNFFFFLNFLFTFVCFFH